MIWRMASRSDMVAPLQLAAADPERIMWVRSNELTPSRRHRFAKTFIHEIGPGRRQRVYLARRSCLNGILEHWFARWHARSSSTAVGGGKNSLTESSERDGVRASRSRA